MFGSPRQLPVKFSHSSDKYIPEHPIQNPLSQASLILIKVALRAVQPEQSKLKKEGIEWLGKDLPFAANVDKLRSTTLGYNLCLLLLLVNHAFLLPS
jgi:hypothetical protein